MSLRALLPLLAALLAGAAQAVTVIPAERVQTRVVVRAEASAAGARLGGLHPGEEARLLESVEGWHHVELPDGSVGYVSAGWTELVPDPPPPSPGDFVFSAERPQPTFRQRVSRLARSLTRPFWASTEVDIEIRHPSLGDSERKHFDPRLPVAGFATTNGSRASFDVILLIDTSGSTGEHAAADVDGDGNSERRWQGQDSILKAEIRAARGFVRALGRLPGNEAGERIRVGVITFAGEDHLHTFPGDRNFRPTRENLLAVAHRDAVVELPLTSDYAAAQERLEEIGERKPLGTTNLAAGIALGLIELTGMDEKGARSRSRHGVRRVIQVLSDGKPRLPYDRPTAEKAARYAGYLAESEGVRINSFELGWNRVTREHSESLQKVAHATGGRFAGIERPGDIVPILAATQLSFVDRVKLVNRTTGEETPYVATGIDGSFYGELPLLAGANEVDVVAVLHDEREAVETLQVRFEPVPEEIRLAEELEHIRKENQVLVEQIRQQLAHELDAQQEEARQRRELELEAHEGPLPASTD